MKFQQNNDKKILGKKNIELKVVRKLSLQYIMSI